MIVKKSIILLLFALLTTTLFAQLQRGDRTIVANGDKVEVTPDKSLGLEIIYVFKSLSGSSISFTTNKNKTARFYTYQNSIADKQLVLPADSVTLGDKKTYSITNLQDSRGLVLDDGLQLCLWIVDYSLHHPLLNSVAPIESDDRCEMLKLMVDKVDQLEYRGTGGQARYIARRYDVVYDIQTWQEDDKKFKTEEFLIANQEIGTEYILPRVPNINTTFTIRGDQFGKAFKSTTEVISDAYEAVAVEAHIVALQGDRNVPNEKAKEDAQELGGSAPVDIQFFGLANEPVTSFYTWLVYNKNNMNDPVARYTDQDFDYSFTLQGNYQVMLEVANAASTCVDTASMSFEVSDFLLDIPNYFSPGSSPGSNDEFRVVYRSIIKYKCVIFNRWGNKVFESSDPAQGWDGRYKGSLVHPGVYYYSIEATGSDGKKRTRGGDINILK